MEAVINVTTSGNTVLIPAPSQGAIRVRSVSFAASSASSIYFYAVGSGTVLTGTYQADSSFGLDFGGYLRPGAGNGLGINSSSAVVIGGVVTYDVVPLLA